MYKKIIGIILSSVLLCLPGCGGSGSITKAFMREGVSLAYIQTVAVLPFEGGGQAPRIREFTTTQLLSSGLFDVVDKALVDNFLKEEAIGSVAAIDKATLRRMGQRLNVQAFILGSVSEISQSRGNAVFPEITITMRLIDAETGKILWQASGRGSGYSLTDRLFGTAPKDSFQVTMQLLNDLFKTMR
jgi:TolB-like protein